LYLAVRVHVELGDDNFGRVEAEHHGGAVVLLAGDALCMEGK
jgi:hypothetical protein